MEHSLHHPPRRAEGSEFRETGLGVSRGSAEAVWVRLEVCIISYIYIYIFI